ALASGEAAGARNLVRNADFERSFLASAPADAWTAERTAPGGQNRRAPGGGIRNGAAHLLSAPAGAPATWWIATQKMSGLRPGDRAIASVFVRTEGVSGGSGAYFGMSYSNARGDRITWTDSQTMLTGTTGWTRLSQPFVVPPGAVRVTFGLVLHGSGRAWFDRAQVVLGETDADWRPREAPRATPARAGLGSIAILRDPTIPATGAASDPAHLRRLAEQAGYRCAYVDAYALADPARLSSERFDLLVLTRGASFPAAAAPNLRAFLQDGGSLLTVGGYPLDRPLVRQGQAWVDPSEVEIDASVFAAVAEPGTGVWRSRSHESDEGPVLPVAGRLAFGVDRMANSGWVMLQTPELAGLPPGSRALAFEARSLGPPVPVAVEVVERDGSRWRKRFEVGPRWRTYAVALHELEYWSDNPSVGRGGSGDHARGEAVARVAFGITTEFVQPGGAYRVEIGRVLAGAHGPPPAHVPLNSATGSINPATFLMPSGDAISICDAGSPLSGVAMLVASPGQPWLPAAWSAPGGVRGHSATGQTAQGYAGAPLKARWVPLADAVDRYGRKRGTAFAVMHHYAGEYPGSTWAYSGISCRDLFRPGDAAGEELFRTALRRLIGARFLFEPSAGLASVRPGESVAPAVHVGNAGSAPSQASVRLTVRADDRLLSRSERRATVPARGGSRLAFSLAVPAGLRARFLHLTFELLRPDGSVEDRIETGAAVWDEERLARGARLTYRDNYFDRGAGPQFLIGSQIYWGNPTSTGSDPLRWREQLRRMAGAGFRIARSFMNVPGGDTEVGWRQRDALVQLAQDAGISLFYTGVSTVTTNPDSVAEQARGAALAAARYRNAPGLFVDIVNEPSIHVGREPSDHEAFRAWLRERYGSTERLREAWGVEMSEPSLDEVRVLPMTGPWNSVRAVDTHRFHSSAMRRWAGETAAAMRRERPGLLVSVGHLQGFGDARTTWDPIESSRDLDFVNRHYYGDLHTFSAELMQIDQRLLGRAPSVGEFGGTSHPGLRLHPLYEREAEIVRRYAYTVHAAFGLGGAFAVNWHWQDPIEDIFPCGLLLADGAVRDRFAAFRAAGLLFGSVQPAYRAPAVWLVLPTSHRFGAAAGRVVSAVNRALDALITLHVGFSVVDEQDLGQLPLEARVLVWPVPYCPEDSAFERVYEWVRAGGSLYVSGDLSFDAQRRRTRTDRLRALCGVEWVREIAPPPDRPEPGGALAATPEGGALGRAVVASGAAAPSVEVRAAGARVLATAGGRPLATLHRLGAGRVLYVTDPIEMHSSPRAVLAAFLAEANVARHRVAPDEPALESHRLRTVDGGVAQVLWNRSSRRVRVEIADLPDRVAVTLGPGSGGAALFDGRGRLVGAEGLRVEAGGARVIDASATAAAISLDGADLRASRGVLVAPGGPGILRLGGPVGRTASVGEVVDGRWREYERATMPVAGLRLDDAMGRSLVLVGPRQNLARLGAQVVRRW
ncbi:MAG TPA: beta-galactosidase, partial [Chthonomonadales bacterium]|nr:beta-galactosidase [Chthonomonadales bacterium]